MTQVAGTANTSVETLYREEGLQQVAKEATRIATEAERGRIETMDVWEDYVDLKRLLDIHIKGQQLDAEIEALYQAAHDMRAAAWIYRIEKSWKPEVSRLYVFNATYRGVLPSVQVVEADVPSQDAFVEAMSRVSDGWATLLLDTPEFRWTEYTALTWFLDRAEEKRMSNSVANILQELRNHRQSSVREQKRTRDDYEAVLFVLAVISVSWERAVRGLPDLAGVVKGVRDQTPHEGYIVLGEGGATIKTEEGDPSDEYQNMPPAQVWYKWAKAVLSDLSMGSVRKKTMEKTIEYKWMYSLATIETPESEAGKKISKDTNERLDAYFDKVTNDVTKAYNERFAEIGELEIWEKVGRIPVPQQRETPSTTEHASSRDRVLVQLRKAAGALDTFLDEREIEVGDFLKVDGGGGGGQGAGVDGKGKGKEKSRMRQVPPADTLVRIASELHDALATVRDAVGTLHSKIGHALKQLFPILEQYASTLEEKPQMKALLDELKKDLEEGNGAKQHRGPGTASATRKRGGPRPGWALRPVFTGRISLSAPALSGLERAFAEVRQRLPGLAPGWMPAEAVKRGLMETPGLSQHFADLVAAHLLESSIRFPRQWMADKALQRAHYEHIGIILRLSSWVWGSGTPYDTGQPQAATQDAAHSPVSYSAMTGAPIPIFPEPLHHTTPRPDPPPPLFPASGGAARPAIRRGKMGGGEGVRSSAPLRLQLGGALVTQGRFVGLGVAPARGRGQKRSRLARASPAVQTICQCFLTNWEASTVRRVVMEMTKKTMCSRP